MCIRDRPYVDSGQLAGAISVFYKDGVQETCCIGYADEMCIRDRAKPDCPARVERGRDILPKSGKRKGTVLTIQYVAENSDPLFAACLYLYAGSYGNSFGIFPL